MWEIYKEGVEMAKPVQVGSESFKTKGEAKERARTILKETAMGEFVADEHLPFMSSLFWMHPDALEKAEGEDFPRFLVGGNGFGYRCFYVVRDDGSMTDFSFNICIDGKRSKEQDFKIACRHVIGDDIKKAKKIALAAQMGLCAVSGEPCTIKDSHLDHAEPWTFQKIMEHFIFVHGIDVGAVEYVSGTITGTLTKFLDDKLAQTFRDFHNERAVLRVVTKHVNLSVLKRKAV